MDEKTYEALLEQHVGYTPGIVVTAEQVAAYNPALVQDPVKNHIIPFGGLILPFHEVIFSSEENVHDFLKSHFTRKLRELTNDRPLYVRAYPVSGWTVLAQLSRKGLIVDQTVRVRVQRLVLNFPSPLRYSTKQHILNKRWYFYTLQSNHRPIVAKHLDERYHPVANQATPQPPQRGTTPSSGNYRVWPKGL